MDAVTFTTDDIRQWLIHKVIALTGLSATEIDITLAMTHFGLDSSALMQISSSLEDWLEIEIPHETLYEYPSIQSLTQYLIKRLNVEH